MPASDPAFELEALTAFAFLSSVGTPRVIDSSYSAEAFGNADIGLEGDDLRVRVVRDRGQYFVTLSPSWTADWFDEHTVLRLIGATDAANQLVELQWKSMRPAADAIGLHLASIVARFSRGQWSDARAAMKRLQEQRARELFGWPAS